MGSTKRRARKVPAAEIVDDGFEDLRNVFRERIESERVHLVSLSAALARAEDDAAWIFEDLQFRAHRLQGGASIFELPDLARAAHALEQAAVSASKSRADNTDEKVWEALVNLVQLMGGNAAAVVGVPA
jgi:HPt (histidine-containing phosphotransfer) domain-containing protein